MIVLTFDVISREYTAIIQTFCVKTLKDKKYYTTSIFYLVYWPSLPSQGIQASTAKKNIRFFNARKLL